MPRPESAELSGRCAASTDAKDAPVTAQAASAAAREAVSW